MKKELIREEIKRLEGKLVILHFLALGANPNQSGTIKYSKIEIEKKIIRLLGAENK